MPRCARAGCGEEFSEANNEGTCQYHPDPPRFHDGRQVWTCCNEGACDFSRFMEIKGCCTAPSHTAKLEKEPVARETSASPKQPASAARQLPKPLDKDQVESLKSNTFSSTFSSHCERVTVRLAENDASDSDGNDDENLQDQKTVAPGTKCLRRGCGYCMPESNNNTASDLPSCVHHPGLPIFHEGSKGWSCCSRRVLEFDDFLKIHGCKSRAKHQFFCKKQKSNDPALLLQEKPVCRRAWYQNPSSLTIDVYAKAKVGAGCSVAKDAGVCFSSTREIALHIDLLDGRVHHESILLTNEYNVEKSRVRVTAAKVEITLIKAEPGMWPALEIVQKN